MRPAGVGRLGMEGRTRSDALRTEADEIARAMTRLAYFIGRVEERRRLLATRRRAA